MRDPGFQARSGTWDDSRMLKKIFACLLFVAPVMAATPEPRFDNPLLRQRAGDAGR